MYKLVYSGNPVCFIPVISSVTLLDTMATGKHCYIGTPSLSIIYCPSAHPAQHNFCEGFLNRVKCNLTKFTTRSKFAQWLHGVSAFWQIFWYAGSPLAFWHLHVLCYCFGP